MSLSNASSWQAELNLMDLASGRSTLPLPRTGISQDHLRSGVSPAGKPDPVAFQSGWRETLAGSARVLAWCRGIGKVRSQRTPAENSRVRLRRSGIGKRAGRSEVVAVRLGIIFGYRFGYTHQLACLSQVTLNYGEYRVGVLSPRTGVIGCAFGYQKWV